jgi:hypothetical protein
MLGPMIGRILAAALLWLAASTVCASAQTATTPRVVVELPRANRLLGEFGRDQDVLILTFGVGMWDYLGWRDTFAQPDFTRRHTAYSRALQIRGRRTPQMILNGAFETTGYDWDESRVELNRARTAERPSGAPTLSATRLRNGRIRVLVSQGHTVIPADVWFVAFDPGPQVVNITGGALANRRMEYFNVVTRLDNAGAWSGAPVYYERARCSPDCAILVQAPNGGPILAAIHVPDPDPTPLRHR